MSTEEDVKTGEDKSKLDLVFLCDCTGSMGSYIAAAQSSITDIITKIKDSDKVDVRFAVIGYEDHCDAKLLHEYGFTANVKEAHSNVSKLYAGGGGDAPEAVEDALKAALELKYRDGATKIVITVSDAPPHGLGNFNGDSYPNGCPLGVDAFEVVRQMVDKDIIIYAVGCEPALAQSQFSRAFFKTIATISGGRYVPLTDASSLPKIIIYGAEEEIQLAKYAEEIEAEDKIVRLELAKEKEELGDNAQTKTDDEILQMVTDRLAARGVKLESMKITDSSTGAEAEKPAYEQEEDDLVSLMSDLSTMAEVRELLKDKKPPAVAQIGFGIPSASPSVTGASYGMYGTAFGGYGPPPTSSFAFGGASSAPPTSDPFAPFDFAPSASAVTPSTSAAAPSATSSSDLFSDVFAPAPTASAPTSSAYTPFGAVPYAAPSSVSSFSPYGAPTPASYSGFAFSAVPAAPPASIPAFGGGFSPAPAAPAPSSFSSAPVSYGYAQEMSSLNVEQVKRVMNRSKNKSSNS
eukprot:TRINITY_DN5731_c0_g1_i1.p1 TRINITY_DN5731_c0_g1~~TRINITY_DN5731_c0_g1_i1.p1  ORF type:complete len:519 (-),score=150.84 TRINITY_DN5731_c0_g1_i1:50-1606(-)